MIVLVVDFDYIRPVESERHSPIAAHSNRPPFGVPPSELMKIEARQIHIGGGARYTEPAQDQPQSIGVGRLDSRL
jgi:hypothetical protein